MLNEAETPARQRGWVTVAEKAIPGMIDRLTLQPLPEVAATLELSSTGRQVTAVALPFHLGGLTWQTSAKEHRPDLRAQLTALTDHLALHGTGLLLTVDELHHADRAGLRELAATIQHCFREERPIAFAGAGLPTAVADLLNDDVLTFLRRADRYHLGAVDHADVADALRTPLNANDHSITDPALEVAAAGTGGYPFLIQLVGFWMCTLAEATTASEDISVIDDVAAAAFRRSRPHRIHAALSARLPSRASRERWTLIRWVRQQRMAPRGASAESLR